MLNLKWVKFFNCSVSAKNKFIIEKIGNIFIGYDINYQIYIREYYLYCINILRPALSTLSEPCNINFGEINIDFNNNLKTLRILFQTEHTLVKNGGRGSFNGRPGKIKCIDDDKSNYLVRIDNENMILNADVVIDYSMANLINIRKSGYYESTLEKIFYIAPIIYEFNEEFNNIRNISCATLIGDLKNGRRRFIFDQVNKLTNINNYSGYYLFVNCLYYNIKVLLNIHQTADHHTFEELRVLPALISGCLVVSEDSPLKEYIRYSKYIIWAKKDEIPEVVRKIVGNYDSEKQRILGSPHFKRRILRIKKANDLIAISIVNKLQGLLDKK
jgi:hypothetical protein